MKKIVFSNGKTLAVGDTFYFTHPEWHDGTVFEYAVESLWHADSRKYGEIVRFIPPNKSTYHFVCKHFFEMENPTCFIDRDDAIKKAQSNDKVKRRP